MEEVNRAYTMFEERNRTAFQGGGVAEIEIQHANEKMTVCRRIDMLLSKGTFVELDKLMAHRCINYNMDHNKAPGDGVAPGYRKIDDRQVFIYIYDFTVYDGLLSASNTKKIVRV